LINLFAVSRSTGRGNNISSPGVASSSSNCYPWGKERFALRQGVHCDAHAFGFDAAGTLYVASDGGVFSSPPDSHGGLWSDLNANLAIAQLYPGIGYQPGAPNRMLGGTQDNGTQTWGGGLWQVSSD